MFKDYHDPLLRSPLYQTTTNYNWWWFDVSKNMVFDRGWLIQSSKIPSQTSSSWRLFIYGKHLPINLYSLDMLGHMSYLSICLYLSQCIVLWCPMAKKSSTKLPSSRPECIVLWCPMAKKSSTKLPSSRPLGPTPIWTDRFQHVDLPTVVFWKIDIDLTCSFLSFKVYDCLDEYNSILLDLNGFMVGYGGISIVFMGYTCHLPVHHRAPGSRHRPSKRLQRKPPNLASWHSWSFLDVVVPLYLTGRIPTEQVDFPRYNGDNIVIHCDSLYSIGNIHRIFCWRCFFSYMGNL